MSLRYRDGVVLKPVHTVSVVSASVSRAADQSPFFSLRGANWKQTDRTCLPAGASEEEMVQAIAAAIAETGASSPKQMGAVMKAAKARLEGKTVDGKVLSDRVRDRLQKMAG